MFACSIEEIKERPDVIICDTPVAIWRIRRYFGRHIRVVYDITEFYPSKKNVRNVSLLLKPLKYILLKLVFLWAGVAADDFIFGEYHKSRAFRFLFPWKRSLLLPYYPSLHYISPRPAHPLGDEVRLFYAGPQTAEKGFERVKQVLQKCQERLPDKHIVFQTVNGVVFEEFCKIITEQDVFLDLRDTDRENTRCLPIKLFYYMAAGRPVIYSDLKSIRIGVPEIANDSLIDPENLERAVEMICEWVAHPDVYLSQCARNRQLAENCYNWEKQSETFIQFIEQS